MESVPLRQHADFSSSRESPRTNWEMVRARIVRWWRLTTHRSYLGNPISRRDVRRMWPTLVYLACAGALGNLKSKSTAALNSFVLVFVWFFSMMRTDRLWSDMFLTVCCIVHSVGMVLINPENDPYTLLLVSFCVQIGVHSLYLMIYVAATSLAFAFAAPEWMLNNAYGFVTVCLSFLNEKRCASQFVELEQERRARFYLLDGGSNGWCTLSRELGMITSSTSRLSQNFGRSCLVGARLSSFVNDADAQRVDELCSEAVLVPFLVTCHTGYCDFDAKIIPYACSEDSVEICFQIQGERRLRHPEGASQGPDTAPQMPARTSAAVDTLSVSADTISHLTAFYPPTVHTNDENRRTQAASVINTVTVATQTETATAPTHSRPPALPAWMSARTAGSESENEAASERSGGPVGRRRKAIRRKPLINFTNEPLLPSFDITDTAAMENGVNWLIGHWNPPKATGINVCCHYHASAQILSLLARRAMTKNPCRPEWRPSDAWQCPACQYLHRSADEDCDVCRIERPDSDQGDGEW